MRKLLASLFILLLLGIYAQAQERTVTGTVKGKDDGLPLPGVSVRLKGSSIGTQTGAKGEYSIHVSGSKTTLVFTYVGYGTQEIAVGTKNAINVALGSDATQLGEVVVVAYGTARKGELVGSVGTVSSKQLGSATTESVDKALIGKVAGIRVSSNTGDPGSSGEINIRGVGSISASTQPLYVIDGVPVKADNDMAYYGKSSNVLSSINPGDIQSITVLKDAASASLYGSRASNGVIVITTKRGASGQTKFNYKGEYGWSKMAVDAFNMMSGADFVKYQQAALEGSYLQDNDALLPTDQNFNNPTILAEAKKYALDNAADAFVDDPTVSTNWKPYIFKSGNSQDHQLSASGGNEKTTFYTGLGYNKTEGIIRGTDFNRYSGRLNLDHKPNKWLSFGLKENFSYTDQNGIRDQSDQAQGIGTTSPVGILFALNPTSKVYNNDGTINLKAGWGKVSNPLAMLDGSDENRESVNTKTYRNLSNGEIGIKFLPELNFKSVLGADIAHVQNFEFWSPSSINGESVSGLGSRYNFTSSTLTSSNTLRYNTMFRQHSLDVLAGFEAQKETLLEMIATAQGYVSDRLPELANGQPNQASSYRYESTLLSYLANLNYNYANKYFLTGSFRRDGSSKLGVDKRWGDFWSVGGSYRLSAEDFMSGLTWLTDLKLRASYGTNGTLPNTYYAYQGLYAFNGGYGSSGAIYLSQPENTKLSWEKSKNLNLGIDAEVFKSVQFSAEYYKKTTTDLLFQVPVSYLTGFETAWQNLGKIDNKGFEFTVHTNNIRTSKAGGLNWTTDLNLTTQKATINTLPNHEDITYGDGNMYIHREGESLYSFNLPVWAGVDPQSGNAQFYVNPGVNDDKAFDYAKAGRTIVGKALPDVTGGFSNTLSFKGFDLSFLITYQFGGNLFDYPGYFSHHYGVRLGSFNLDKEIANNYWTEPGQDAKYPRPVYQNLNRPDRWSSQTIKSTDNIRLREVSLGYNLPKSIAGSLFAQNIRVYARAQNLAMIWAKTKGIDPDVPLNGYRQTDTPPTRVIFAGVSLDF